MYLQLTDYILIIAVAVWGVVKISECIINVIASEKDDIDLNDFKAKEEGEN